jgi:hypothetical protein
MIASSDFKSMAQELRRLWAAAAAAPSRTTTGACLHEAVKFAVKARFTDLGVDLVGDLAPPASVILEPFSFDGHCGPIKCDPCHDFRMNEVLPAAAHLPSTFIGVAAKRSPGIPL